MKRLQLLLSLGLASTLLLAACGGDDDDDDGGDATNTPAASQTTSGGGTPSDGETPQATNTPEDDDDDDDNGDGGSALEEALRDLADRKFQATYEMSAEVDGAKQTGTMIIAQDKPRFATIMEFSEGTIAIIETEEGAYSCFGAGDFGTCTRGDTGEGSIFDLRDISDEAGDLSGFDKVEDRNINGRDSSCWTGVEGESEIETTFCISKSDGILTFSGSEDIEIALTDFSEDVDDEVFELPYETM